MGTTHRVVRTVFMDAKWTEREGESVRAMAQQAHIEHFDTMDVSSHHIIAFEVTSLARAAAWESEGFTRFNPLFHQG